MADAPRPDIHATPLGNGRYLVTEAERQWVVYAAGSPDARWVFINGVVYVVDATEGEGGNGAGKKRKRVSDGQLALAAPMPATVTLVNVASDQEVAQGDMLIMLEAMKMELSIKAPRAGRVKAIACRAGELVQPGMPLVELE